MTEGSTAPPTDRLDGLHRYLELARGLVPALRERAPEGDLLRRLPDTTVEDLRATGLFGVYRPVEYGGPGLAWGSHVQIALELGRGDGAAAWCFSIAAAHNWAIGLMDPRAARDVWTSGSDAVASSATAVASASGGSAPAQAQRAGDDFLLDGVFSFSSGIDHSQWVCLGTSVQGEASGTRYFLLPRAEVELLDTWHTTGLRGTGSRDVRVRQRRVPSYRTFAFSHAGGPSAGSSAHREALFRLNTPFMSIYPFFLASPVVGMARGGLEAFTTGRMGSTPPVQAALSESAAEVDAAQLLLERDCAEVNALTERNETASMEQAVRFGRDAAYAARLCLRALDRLVPESGAHGVYERHPFQRYWRDLHTATSHAALRWTVMGHMYGALLLGA